MLYNAVNTLWEHNLVWQGLNKHIFKKNFMWQIGIVIIGIVQQKKIF